MWILGNRKPKVVGWFLEFEMMMTLMEVVGIFIGNGLSVGRKIYFFVFTDSLTFKVKE